MKWSKPAQDALSRVPFFVRKRVRKRVEEEAVRSGSDEVEPKHMETCRRRFLQNMENEVKGYQVETCFGPSGCPNRAVTDENLAKDLEMACGGAVSVLIEPFGPRDRAVICGGGHIARQLCEILARCNMEVWVADGRPDFATKDHFPRASKLFDRLDPKTAVADLELGADRYNDFVVVVTNTHALDKSLVLEMLPLQRLTYLGMVASRSKAAATRRAAQKAGMDADLIARLRSPVGLPIGGASPAEIAVSIAAEIQAVRYGRSEMFQTMAIHQDPHGSHQDPHGSKSDAKGTPLRQDGGNP